MMAPLSLLVAIGTVGFVMVVRVKLALNEAAHAFANLIAAQSQVNADGTKDLAKKVESFANPDSAAYPTGQPVSVAFALHVGQRTAFESDNTTGGGDRVNTRHATVTLTAIADAAVSGSPVAEFVSQAGLQ